MRYSAAQADAGLGACHFGVVPDYDLNIMKDRQTLFNITTNILNGINEVLEKERPDVILVHGDTSTTFVTSLA